jgi:4'-phosphopantetheinyl transferase
MSMTSHNRQWNSPTGDLRLSEHEVHIWRASLNTSLSLIHHLQQLLTEDEVVRAGRFAFERDRHHFIVARGILRAILGRYLSIRPGFLRFDTNAYGKPYLGLPRGKPPLKFNLAHSHDLALYAFTHSREVGVDIEYMRADIDYEELAKYSFSQYEQSILRTLPEVAKQQAFFHCWTRKEAYIKARGKGLSIPLDLFDVSLGPGEPPVLINSREDPQETARWSFRDLNPGPGYASALVVEGSEWSLKCWQWEEEHFFSQPDFMSLI